MPITYNMYTIKNKWKSRDFLCDCCVATGWRAGVCTEECFQ